MRIFVLNGYVAMRLKQRYGIPYIVTGVILISIHFKRMIHLRKLGRILLIGCYCVFIRPYKDGLWIYKENERYYIAKIIYNTLRY